MDAGMFREVGGLTDIRVHTCICVNARVSAWMCDCVHICGHECECMHVCTCVGALCGCVCMSVRTCVSALCVCMSVCKCVSALCECVCMSVCARMCCDRTVYPRGRDHRVTISVSFPSCLGSCRGHRTAPPRHGWETLVRELRQALPQAPGLRWCGPVSTDPVRVSAGS